MTTIDWIALAAPFPEDVVKWRVGSVSNPTPGKDRRCTLLAYIDARIVMDRLDDVAGPENWRVSYAPAPAGGVMACLEVRVDGEWIGKCDASDNTDIEATKGGVSGALKRAAVCWGIGRYLYDLDASWHVVRDGWANGKGIDISTKQEKHIGWVPTPTLPEWARPKAPARTVVGAVVDVGTASAIETQMRVLGLSQADGENMLGRALGVRGPVQARDVPAFRGAEILERLATAIKAKAKKEADEVIARLDENDVIEAEEEQNAGEEN